MLGRFIGFVAGLALLAESYALWKPQSVGAFTPPDLGPFTPYQPLVAGLAAAIGLAVIIASLLRAPGEGKAKRRAPAAVDFASDGADAFTLAPLPTAHPAPEPEPEPFDPPAAHHAPEPAPVAAVPPPPEPVHAVHEHAPEPRPVASAATASPDRAAFLAAMDEGDQLRAADRLADAIDPYSSALDLARARHAAQPGDTLASRDLANALTSVADVHDREGRLDTALDLHEESLALRRKLAIEAPEDIACQRGLSLGLERLADTREARGHNSRARDLFRERLPLTEKLVSAAPSDMALQNDLMTTRQRLAELDGQIDG